MVGNRESSCVHYRVQKCMFGILTFNGRFNKHVNMLLAGVRCLWSRPSSDPRTYLFYVLFVKNLALVARCKQSGR